MAPNAFPARAEMSPRPTSISRDSVMLESVPNQELSQREEPSTARSESVIAPV
eukprot:m.447409 g.447409  ORF g.447409 m.447409 type:complete len:53 (+) comp19511_c0_seq1:2990-3148(+)